MNKYVRKAKENRKIALERVQILQKLMENEPDNPYNNKYKELITKIQKKYKV